MGSMMLEVRKIFNMAQDGVVVSRLCEILLPLQDKSTEEDFWHVFLNHLQKSMIYYKADTAVERVMNFIAMYATYPSLMKSKAKDTPSEESECSDDESMDPFLLKMLNFLIQKHNARDKGVRYRCCQLVNKILSHMADDETIDEELSDLIYECMMIRLKDKFPSIRIQAVLALVRLQDPEDEECPVIDAFLHSMETDTNADVRKAILSNIALSRKTLPYVLGRIRDVKDVNRKVAYLTLSEKVSIRALTIAQRINVLTVGLKDRSENVKEACGQLLKAWLRLYDHSVIKLLEALDTEGSPECSASVLETIFKDISIEKMQTHVNALLSLAETIGGNVKMIDHESLTPENIYYWYMICKHLKKMGHKGELLLQQVLPELTNYCEYIQRYAEKYFIDSAILMAFEGKEAQPEFILEHLLNIAGLLDFSDEVGRKNLQQLVHDLLVVESIPILLSTTLVSRFVDVESNEEKFVQVLVETISDIKQPMVQVVTTAMKEDNRRIELQLARITVNLNECKEELETAIKSQDFQQAALLKDQIAELQEQRGGLLLEQESTREQIPQRIERDDPETMLKCLSVASSMLSQLKRKGLNSTLMALKDELIFEGVKNEDPFIRNEAVKCLGHLSLLHKEFACQHLVLFLQVAQVDQELLQITAVQIIFDLFLIYGLQAFDTEAESTTAEKGAMDEDETERTIVEETPPQEQEEASNTNNAAESVLGILMLFMESESADLRTVVAEGMAKLLMSGRVVSAKILTRLILLWYNPITEDDTKLRHCLGVFLPVFAFENRSNQELIEESFMPVMKTLLNAPSTSPLSQINISNVIDLLIQLTNVKNLVQFNDARSDRTTGNLKENFETHVHDSIALKVANEILSDPEDADIKLLCRTLNQLSVCPNNITAVQDLLELSLQIIEALNQNRFAKKMVEKFHLHLETLIANQEVGSTPVEETTGTVDEEMCEDVSEDIRETTEEKDQEEANDNVNTDAKNSFSESDTTLTDIGAIALQKQLSEPRPTRSEKHKLHLSNDKSSSSKKSRLSSSRGRVDFLVNAILERSDDSDTTIENTLRIVNQKLQNSFSS